MRHRDVSRGHLREVGLRQQWAETSGGLEVLLQPCRQRNGHAGDSRYVV